MGRTPCCDKANVKKGPWSPEEDAKLKEYIEKHGTGGSWISLPQKAGLKRCGKSCRLRWLNYLRPNIKHGEFSDDEDRIICTLYANIGSRWSIIAAQLPGRTDNDIKNYWNTKLKKKLMGIINMAHVQRRLVPQQATPTNFLSLPSSPSPPMSSSSSSYNSYYKTLIRPFTEPSVSFSSSPLSSNNSMITTSSIQESFLSPMQHYKVNQGSCSSSNVKEEGEQKGYDQSNYCDFYSGEESEQKMMGSNAWGENLSDYGSEEIKQLISGTSSDISNINNHSFLFGEIKAGERVLY